MSLKDIWTKNEQKSNFEHICKKSTDTIKFKIIR